MIPTAKDMNRLIGLDVARALAICGMTFIHFAMVLSSQQMKESSFGWIVDRLSGRPATMFMILAGIGISLRVARFLNVSDTKLEDADLEDADFGGAELESDKPRVAGVGALRSNLLKRGVFFLVAGFANLLVWPGDILRVYGVAYLLAAVLLLTSTRWLWGAAASFVSIFVAMVFVVDFETNWNFETLSYANLWTLGGAAFNLLYNGFRAVLPWVGLLFVGMILGRLNLRDKRVCNRLIMAGLATWLGTEVISLGLVNALLPWVAPAEKGAIIALFGTESMPAMPLFLLSSSGLAVAVIMSCIRLAEASNLRSWQPIVSTGQMAFTWYIGHIIVVIGAGILTEFKGETPLLYTFLISLFFCGFMFGISWLYRRRFRQGPLEWILRTAT